MTRTVNFLEAEGYLARRPHDRDGRQVAVTLTVRGRETVPAETDPVA